MKKLEKMAQQDAEKWASAEMFYGPGAGTRRKLVNAEIESNLVTYADTDYADLFNLAYEHLDMNKFAQAAIRERKALDRAAKTSQNLRALKSGNLNNLTTGVAVVVGAAYLAHATGYDKKIEAEAKKLYKRAKTEIKFRKMRWQGLNVEKIIG